MNFLIFLSATLSLAYASPRLPFINKSRTIDISPEDFKNVISKHLPIQIQLNPKDLKELQKNIRNNDSEVLTASLNDYMDKLITNIDVLIKNQNYDPLDLPNIKESVTYHILWLIPYTGSLKMKHGKLKGTSTIFRNGESVASYDKDSNYLSFKTNIAFNSLKFSYLYHLSIPLIFKSRGICEGGVTDLDINVAVGVNFDTGLINLDDFSLPNSGHITIIVQEFSLTPNWVLDLILNTCTAVLKNYILEALSTAIRTPLETVIGALNYIIQTILSF